MTFLIFGNSKTIDSYYCGNLCYSSLLIVATRYSTVNITVRFRLLLLRRKSVFLLIINAERHFIYLLDILHWNLELGRECKRERERGKKSGGQTNLV